MLSLVKLSFFAMIPVVTNSYFLLASMCIVQWKVLYASYTSKTSQNWLLCMVRRVFTSIVGIILDSLIDLGDINTELAGNRLVPVFSHIYYHQLFGCLWPVKLSYFLFMCGLYLRNTYLAWMISYCFHVKLYPLHLRCCNGDIDCISMRYMLQFQLTHCSREKPYVAMILAHYWFMWWMNCC